MLTTAFSNSAHSSSAQKTHQRQDNTLAREREACWCQPFRYPLGDKPQYVTKSTKVTVLGDRAYVRILAYIALVAVLAPLQQRSNAWTPDVSQLASCIRAKLNTQENMILNKLHPFEQPETSKLPFCMSLNRAQSHRDMTLNRAQSHRDMTSPTLRYSTQHRNS